MSDVTELEETPDGSWEKSKKPAKKAAKRAQPHKPDGVKQPQDHKGKQKSAAQAEAEAPDDLVAIEFRGETFHGLPVEQWTTLARQAFATGTSGGYWNGVERVLGSIEWLRFNRLFPMPADFDEFLTEFSAAYGFGTAGN